MRFGGYVLRVCMLTGLIMQLAGCALPSIQRDNAHDASMPVSASTTDAAMHADPDDADAGPNGYDPMWDPANRNEDFETFQSLVPTEHRFAEWPMSDTFDPAKAKPSFSATELIVTDNVTQLRWQRVLPDIYPGCTAKYNFVGRDRAVGSGCTWEQAQKYCGDPELAKALGGGAWRVPTKIELESILDLSRVNTVHPLLDTFPIDKMWTANPYPNPHGLKLAWAVDFMEGWTGPTARYSGGRVRCVSSPKKVGGRWPDYDFRSEYMVRDRFTGLVWQARLDSETRSWDDARAYCAALDTEGGGWRLPLLKELLSIVDPTRFMSATFQSTFGGTPNAGFWTATEAINNRDEMYLVDFAYGGSLHEEPKARHYTRCVR